MKSLEVIHYLTRFYKMTPSKMSIIIKFQRSSRYNTAKLCFGLVENFSEIICGKFLKGELREFIAIAPFQVPNPLNFLRIQFYCCISHVPEVLNVQMNEIFFLNSILSKNIILNTNKNKYYIFFFNIVLFSV